MVGPISKFKHQIHFPAFHTTVQPTNFWLLSALCSEHFHTL